MGNIKHQHRTRAVPYGPFPKLLHITRTNRRQLPAHPRLHLRHGRATHQLRRHDHARDQPPTHAIRTTTAHAVHPRPAHGRRGLLQRLTSSTHGPNSRSHGRTSPTNQLTRCGCISQTARPLAGAERILADLSRARSAVTGERVLLALASSSKTQSYELKTTRPETKALLAHFPAARRVLGDDVRVKQGRGKLAPDIYLIALEALSAAAAKESGGVSAAVKPNECLVFEDSVAGVESARRAGMRVIWVPHRDVAGEYQAIEKEVLAGRTGMFEVGDDGQLGEVDDGWAESISNLEEFDYEKYGITVLP